MMTYFPGRKLLLCALLLILVACGPLTPESPGAIAAAAQARAQADYARATANSAEYMARANEMALTATAEAPSIRMTQQAAELEIYMTRQAVGATATAQSWTPTPSQTPTPNLTATVSVMQLQAQQTVTAKQSSDYIITSELDLQRQILLNKFVALLPVLAFMALVAVFGLAIWQIVRSKRFQPAPVNAQGIPIPIVDINNGSVTDPHRMPNYRGYTSESVLRDLLLAYILRKLEIPPALPEITPERQDRATLEAQTVEMARAVGSPRGLSPALANMPTLSSPESMSASRFEIVDDESRFSEIPPEIWKILNAQWENV